MKNLEKYGVQPLNATNTQEINGGCPWCIVIVGAAIVEIIGDWENFKAGLSGQPPVEN